MREKTLLCSRCQKSRTGCHDAYCTKCFRIYKKLWYQANKESEVKRVIQYIKLNRARHNRNMRLYRKGISAKKSRSSWVKNNRDKIRIYDARKRAKRLYLLNLSFRDLTLTQWLNIKSKHNFRCFWCNKKKKLTIDHFIPLSRGGKHSASNIVPACSFCNGSKWNKLPHIFAEQIGKKLP